MEITMTETTNHEEVLELLANKKISVDEAMQMLSGANRPAAAIAEATPAMDVLKAEENEAVYTAEVESLKTAEATLPGKQPLPAEKTGSNHKPKWLRIRVRELDSGRNRVTVNLPLGIVNFGLSVARRFGAESEDVDLDELAARIKEAEPGILVDVEDEEDNEHVQISLE
jgi:hypothetical protein